MALTLNLEKAAQTLRLNLEKAGVVKPPVLEVGFGMDVSGSFEDEHSDGITNQLLSRLFPWSLAFDPDRKADLFTFSDGPGGVDAPGPVTEQNYKNYIQSKVINRVNGWCGATDYSYVVERMLEHFGWKPTVKKASFFAKLTGKQDEVVQGDRKRSLAIIITDGANDDRERTINVLRESEARKDQVYFLFVGVSNQGTRFPYLESLSGQFSNVGFVSIPDLNSFVDLDDEAINQKFIGSKLIDWLKH